MLKFNQKPWMQKYIMFNTSKRIEAKNDFEKSFFKLMNNAVYGKTLEDLRKRQNIKLITQQYQFDRFVKRPG